MLRNFCASLAGLMAGGLLAAGTVYAEPSVGIFDCDELMRADTIVEPWHENTRTFANGKIRIAHLDTAGEPVCCSSHLLVILKPQSLDGKCLVVRQSDGMGYNWLDFKNIQSTYDPSLGVGLSVPVFEYDPETGAATGPQVIRLRINQATQHISVE